jgi:hypothetical protein
MVVTSRVRDDGSFGPISIGDNQVESLYLVTTGTDGRTSSATLLDHANDVTPPAPPPGLTVSTTPLDAGDALYAAWGRSPSTDASGYLLDVYTDDGGHAHYNLGTLTSYTLFGLDTGKRYRFTATAYDTAGNTSPATAEVEGRPQRVAGSVEDAVRAALEAALATPAPSATGAPVGIARIDAGGGQLTSALGDVQVTVPPRALAAPATLRISPFAFAPPPPEGLVTTGATFAIVATGADGRPTDVQEALHLQVRLPTGVAAGLVPDSLQVYAYTPPAQAMPGAEFWQPVPTGAPLIDGLDGVTVMADVAPGRLALFGRLTADPSLAELPVEVPGTRTSGITGTAGPAATAAGDAATGSAAGEGAGGAGSATTTSGE